MSALTLSRDFSGLVPLAKEQEHGIVVLAR
jgi:hypothetical protein